MKTKNTKDADVETSATEEEVEVLIPDDMVRQLRASSKGGNSIRIDAILAKVAKLPMGAETAIINERNKPFDARDVKTGLDRRILKTGMVGSVPYFYHEPLGEEEKFYVIAANQKNTLRDLEVQKQLAEKAGRKLAIDRLNKELEICQNNEKRIYNRTILKKVEATYFNEQDEKNRAEAERLASEDAEATEG